MSKLICVMGESGSGKSTSMRNLDPRTTFYIDVDGKGLVWKGWRDQYGTDKKNYCKTMDIPKILALIQNIGIKAPDIKTIVIDTLNTAMVDKEVRAMSEKGYDKWVDLAQYVWSLIRDVATLRDDLTIIFVMHSETVRDDSGAVWTHIRTNGRKLEKLVLESLFNVVLLAKKNDAGEYVFETVSNHSTAKAPMGALDKEVPNDMAAVLKILADY